MVIYISDRFGKILATCSSELPKNSTLIRDNITDDLQSGVRVFECTLASTDKIKSCAKAGNYVMAYDSPFIIVSSTYSSADNTISLYCEDAGLDFINKIVGTIAKTSKTFKQWIEWALGTSASSGWKYNYNIANTSKSLEYIEETNAQERLLDILDNYNAEMYFSYEINGFEWVERTINFVQKRGNKEKIHQLHINKEVLSITETTDISQLATVWKLYGKDNKALSSLSGYSSVPKTYTKGEHTYKVSGSEVICVEGLDKWKSSLAKTGRIMQVKYTEYTSAKDCINYALREMEKIVEPILTYEVEFVYLPKDIQCGDYVYVLDDEDGILLKARVLSWSKSESDGIDDATLGDFVIVEGSKAQIVNVSSNVDLAVLSLSSTAGLIGRGSLDTTIVATLYRNNEVITSNQQLSEGERLVWYEDGEEMTDERVDDFSINVSISEGHSYSCELIVEDIENE